MKKTNQLILNLFLYLVLIFSADKVQAQTTRVNVTGIRSAKGQLVINVFKDQASYDEQKPWHQFLFDKKTMAAGMAVVHIDLPPGSYGLTLIDDENENNKIDKNFIGIPKEGFGFSNFYMTKMKKPVFDDFKVEVKPGDSKIEIKVKYM